MKLLGIDKDDICATALGPAYAYINLDILEGYYILDIKYQSDTDTYGISIKNLSILVGAIDSTYTSYQIYDHSFF